jgi:hypothetical protein
MSYGLDNGIMMSKRCADFPRLWYSKYESFNASQWDEYSIRLPRKLYKNYENKSHIRIESSFYSEYSNDAMFNKKVWLYFKPHNIL